MAAAETVPLSSDREPLPFFSQYNDGDTHALRNPHLPQQAPRIFNRPKLSEAQKATRSLRAASEKEKHAALVSGLDLLLAKHSEEIEALAKEHSVSAEYLNKLHLQSHHFKDKRSVSIMNAKIHAKAIEVNAGKRPNLILTAIAID